MKTPLSPDAALALLSLAPALSLLFSRGRSKIAIGAFFVLAAAAGGGAILLGRGAAFGIAAIAASAGGAGLALAFVVREHRERADLESSLREARSRLDAAEARVSEAKRTGFRVQAEERESLILYEMAKSLPEALSWEEIRPKLESALSRYLDVREFALYAWANSPAGLRLMAARRLEGSPGASWATLKRLLEEQRLDMANPHLIETPERALAVPIKEGSEVLGYLYARLPAGADGRALFEKARDFAADASFAFRRIRLFEEVESLSRVDGLTGVHRRGDFDERLRYEITRAKTFKSTCALLIIDIDHFKEFNDRHGHPFGDRVLRRIGEILNGSFYETDYVARYGGEEFVVVLPRAEFAGALRKAESVRLTIQSERFPAGFETVSATVSIGLAFFPRDAATPEELISRADAALYRAKSSGRNRVVDNLTA